MKSLVTRLGMGFFLFIGGAGSLIATTSQASLAKGEPIKLSCNLIPGKGDKAVNDQCGFESSGRLGSDRFSMPKQVTLTWSDGVRTKITFLGEDFVKPNVYVGIAKVDNSYASFIKAGDGGVCLKILANENSICYR
jgi:hypothetical protein